MMIELGHYAFIFATLLIVVNLGTLQFMKEGTNTSSSLSFLIFGLVAFSFTSLVHAYLISDFSVINVYLNSHTEKPFLYKLVGVWSNHEGSMLLWCLVLTILYCLITFNKKNPLTKRTWQIFLVIMLVFFLFSLTYSNPFLRLLPVPPNGKGLNPLLQDPSLAFHPPTLYLGYVGMSLPYAFGLAALWEKPSPLEWVQQIKPWVYLVWGFLTLGITMGSWWAYYELGWGGWWFWDPVENAALLPWLATTILLHLLRKEEVLKTNLNTPILWAILSFCLSIFGTFLTRSGFITSVHSFAVDPERGRFFLALFAIVTLFSLGLWFLKRHPAPKTPFHLFSKEGIIRAQNILLGLITGIIFTATFAPFIAEHVFGKSLLIEENFFNTSLIPFLIPLTFLLVLGGHLPWKKARFSFTSQVGFSSLVTFLSLMGVLYFFPEKPTLSYFSFACAIWILLETLFLLFRPQKNIPMILAHLGFSITLIGMSADTFATKEFYNVLKVGEEKTLGPYTFRFSKMNSLNLYNYQSAQGVFEVIRGNKFITTLLPEKRHYFQPEMDTTEAALYSNALMNLNVFLARPLSQEVWVVRLVYRPLVPWIWYGGWILFLSALIGFLYSLQKRRRMK